MNNKSIVIIGTTASNLYLFRKEFIIRCQKDGYQVYTFISEFNEHWADRIQSLGATVITYALSRGGLNPIKDILSTVDLFNKIRKIQPDIVFTYSAKPIIYGSLAAKIAKVPRVVGMLEGLGYTFTEQPDGYTTKTNVVRSIQVLLYKIAIPQLDHFIVLNTDDKKDLLDHYSIQTKKTSVLGGIGLDLSNFRYREAPTNPIRFLFIGRLLREKGIFEFIDALTIVKQRYPDAIFTVLGEIDHENLGALTKDQLDHLLQLGLFEYLGYVMNVVEWIQKSSVFVLPSYREGVPRSTQEAMAIGRPIITTDAPGCRETVINNHNGFLIPKWNANALAKKMIYFIENPHKINEMGLESHKMALELFDTDQVNDKLFNIVVGQV